MDNEIKGVGNSINYTYRMHDPRVGRFFAVDPLTPEYPWNSPYAFSENDVIASIELEGLEKVPANEIWNLRNNFTTVTLQRADVNFENFQIGIIHGKTVTLHPIEFGANKGNYIAGMYRNGEFELGYLVGKDRVGGTLNAGDLGSVAASTLLQEWLSSREKPLKFSRSLNAVSLANHYGYGEFDNSTGEYFSERTISDGYKEIVLDPFNWIPTPGKVKVKPSLKGYQFYRSQTKGLYTKEKMPNLNTQQRIDFRKRKYEFWRDNRNVEVSIPISNPENETNNDDGGN